MIDKLINWIYYHSWASLSLLAISFIGVVYVICSGDSSEPQMEQAKTADFVMYTSDGEKLGVEHEIIVDMDTGYQYLVFNVHGEYIIAPRVSEDGSFYKTVE